jgi:hypothetical protein
MKPPIRARAIKRLSDYEVAATGLPQLVGVVVGRAAVVIVSVVVMPGVRVVVVALVGIQVMPSVCVVVVALMGAMVRAFVGAVVMAGMRIVVVVLVGMQAMPSVCVVVVALMGAMIMAFVGAVVMAGMRIVVVVLVGMQAMPSVCVVVVALMGAMIMAFVGAVVMAGMSIVVVMGTVVIAFVQLFGRCHICGFLVEDLIRRPSNSSTVEARPGFQMAKVVVFQTIGSRFLELERQVAHSVLLVDHPSHVVQ